MNELTPLHLDILMHWFVCSAPFKNVTDTAIQYTQTLVKAGYIYPTEWQEHKKTFIITQYKLTPFGEVLVQKIMNTLNQGLL